MTGKGPRHERETIFRFDEESDEVDVWTASEIIYRKLKKNGFYPYDESDRSAAFKMPKSTFRIPRLPSEARVKAGLRLSESRKAKLLEGSEEKK